MNCKHCGAPLDENARACPQCGQPPEEDAELTAQPAPAGDLPEEPAETAAPAEEEAAESAEAEEAAESAEAEDPETEEAAAEEAPETAPAGRKNGGTIVMLCLIAALVVAVIVLVVMLARGRSSTAEAPQETAENAAAEEEFTPAGVSYTHADAADFDDALLDQALANCGDSTLTNRTLAYYYWREFYSLASSYGSYLSYVMDPYARLDSQLYDETHTWDEIIMNYALDTYSVCAAACQQAKADGYQLPAEEQAILDSLEETITAYAAQYGYESADAYLQESFGPYCTMADYRTYMEEYYLATSYLSSRIAATEVNADILSDYYDENAESYAASGLEKDDTCMISVRHILIQPEAVTLSEDDEGYEEAVQAAKDAARAKAEDLYHEWQEGEQTEDRFSELAVANSADGGSAANGGLYENVAPGQMVEAFNDWCFDPARQPGDSGIVETDYGYHIMYFVATGDTPYWQTVVKDDYISSCYSALCEELTAAYPAETDLSKAAVYACNTTAAG